MGDVIINGTITTVGMLSITMPNVSDHEGFPVMSRGIDADGKPFKTGYLPATTLRGFLRRAVVMHDMREAAAANSPYSLPKAYAELIGQDAASEKPVGEIDLLEIKRQRDESPVIDLFGSGLSVSSRLRVGHFVPHLNILPEHYPGVRKDLGDTEGAVELFSAADATAYYRRKESGSRRSKAASLVTILDRKVRVATKKQEDVTELTTQLEEAKKLAEKSKEEMGDMQVSSLNPGMGYCALPAELDLLGRLVILNAKDRDLSMIEFGLDCLSRSPVLGAQSARGCGEITGSFDVVIDGETKKKITIGGYSSAKI